MDAPVTRPSRVREAIRAGSYWYRGTPGAKPVRADVSYVHGDCIVRFEDGSEQPLKHLVPDWRRWAESFERISG